MPRRRSNKFKVLTELPSIEDAEGAGLLNLFDPDNPDTYTINPLTGDTLPAGTVAANHGYLFDPAGGDGVPFNGDEPLAPTGYFFTYNFM